MKNRIKIKNLYKLLVLILTMVLICTNNVYAFLNFDNIKFDHPIKVDWEISNAFIQDSDGFFWFGTNGALVRYDGINLKYYRKGENSVSGNTITELYEDEYGYIWIGTFGTGLNRYNKKTGNFTHYKNNPVDPTSLSSDSIDWGSHSICEDEEGNLWIGTSNGLNKYNRVTDSFKVYRHYPDDSKSLSSNIVKVVYSDNRGNLWIGTINGLNKYDKNSDSFIRYTHNPDNKDSIKGKIIRAIYDDSEANLWIATEEGLEILDRENNKFIQAEKSYNNKELGSKGFQHIAEDEYGNLYFSQGLSGLLGGGITVIEKNTNKVHHLNYLADNPYSISNNYVSKVYFDALGIMWVVCGSGHIDKYDKKSRKFHLYEYFPNNPSGLKSTVVVSIYEDSNDIVWVGTGSGGLHRYDREKDYFISYPYDLNDPELLPNPYNPCIYEDSSDTFWVSSYGGSISIFDREKEKVEKTYYHNPDDPNSIPRNQQVRVILEDKDNPDILWLAGHECGVIKFNKKKDTFKLYGVVPDNPNSLSNYWIYDMYDDGRGNLWVPTQYGLNKLDKKNETFTHYYYEPNNPMSISSNQIFGVFEDSSGFLWFATGGGGLNKFDRETEKFEHFSLENGFPANDVRTVLEDDNGYLWIGSGGNGLIKFNPEDKTYNIYGTDDGLQGNTFFESSKLKTKDGEFWFGGVNGCNRFYPEDIKDNKYIPPVFLTSFKQRGKDVNFDKAIEYMNEIELNWNNNFFSFEMIALNYTKPEKNKYAYYLEGLEEEWNYIDTRRFGNYTSLPTGNYILRIKASNNDGVWNEEGISVNINVIPPFWNTWWFIALCIIAGILLILTIYYLRITNIKKNEEKLSGLVNERTQELSKAKEELEIAYEEMEQSNEELINTNEELEQTVVQLRETQEVLIIQEKMASLGNLVAGVAHEINTPIGIGITASSHLDEKTREYNEIHKSRELKPEELDKFLDMLSRTSKIILSNLTRAAGMIKSFKQVAVDQTNENKRIFNLKRYIEDDILLSLRPELKKTKHKINVNCEEDLEINSYPSAYYQIISNLVLNSIIHGFEDIKIGEINIDVTKKENNIILEYRDNGKGIDENIITKIFDPFFTTKRGVGGTGLGLNIVYNTVTQTLKGTIECYNLDEKNGVKFTLYIPI